MSTVEALFRDRVPEAAARQLATVLAWLTECELATLEGLQMRKSSSAYSVRRHQGICEKAVAQCRELGVHPQGLNGAPCPRLTEALNQPVRVVADTPGAN